MTAPLFLADPLPAAPSFTLAGPEGRHAATVRRLRAGERVDVTDGRGTLVACAVTSVGRDQLELAVERRTVIPEPAPRLVVVQALAKGERGELAVELLSEVGVDEIVPWAASRSIVRWDGDRGRRSLERWRSTAREAAKQSRRVWWPVIADLAGTRDVCARLAAAADPVVLHEEATGPLLPVARPAPTTARGGTVVLVVGPEGGIAPDELAAFLASGARAAVVGPTVLRTSTAGAVAAALVLAASGRWTTAEPAAPI
ncbi:MAG: 16S rRNA (uracil(1498)-N(3))-methyltransferase [Frankia sp.]